MENVESWGDTFMGSLQDLWVKLVGFIPDLLGALAVLIIGLILASLLAGFAKKLFELTRLDSLSEKLGLSREMEDVGLKFRFSDVIAWVVKWFFIVATLIAVVDILRIPQVTGFLEKIALYIPNVLVAILLLAVGLVAGRFLETMVQKGLGATSMAAKSSIFLSVAAKWAVIIFAVLAALLQLGIAENLLQTLFSGVVFMIALAGGLAFGLGGKETASNIISWIDKELTGAKDRKN